MTGCRSAAKLAMGVMQQFTSNKLGDTIQECKNLLEQHHQKIKDVFEDSRLSALQVEGEQILIRLQEDQTALPSVPDYVETVNCVTKLYHQMNEVFCKLEMLTENRTRKLEQCLALKEFEKEMHEVKPGKTPKICCELTLVFTSNSSVLNPYLNNHLVTSSKIQEFEVNTSVNSP